MFIYVIQLHIYYTLYIYIIHMYLHIYYTLYIYIIHLYLHLHIHIHIHIHLHTHTGSWIKFASVATDIQLIGALDVCYDLCLKNRSMRPNLRQAIGERVFVTMLNASDTSTISKFFLTSTGGGNNRYIYIYNP